MNYRRCTDVMTPQGVIYMSLYSIGGNKFFVVYSKHEIFVV